jgi:hypothetical protein
LYFKFILIVAFGGDSRGGFRTRQNFNHQRFADRPTNAQPAHPFAQFIQLLPFLLMLLWSLFSILQNDDDVFSFQKTREYNYELKTPLHNVQYFVNSGIYQQKYSNPKKKKNLENSVEDEYYRGLQHQCYRERETQRIEISRAASWFSGSKVALERAKKKKLFRCEELQIWHRNY